MWGVIIIIALIVCVVFAARELFARIDEADFNDSYDDKHDKGDVMNKTTLKNLKTYVIKNVLKFVRQPANGFESIYKYKELKIGCFQELCGQGIIYYIEIAGKDISNKIPRELIIELYNKIEQRKEQSEQYIQRQAYNNFIKKINKDAK